MLETFPELWLVLHCLKICGKGTHKSKELLGRPLHSGSRPGTSGAVPPTWSNAAGTRVSQHVVQAGHPSPLPGGPTLVLSTTTSSLSEPMSTFTSCSTAIGHWNDKAQFMPCWNFSLLHTSKKQHGI